MSTPSSILSPHDPTWATEFAALRDVYAAAMGDLILRIEHVGSTSIPYLRAKPIIDIDIVMQDYDVFSQIVEVLGRLGYMHQGDQGIPQREVFKAADGPAPRTSPQRPWMLHHLYVCPVHGVQICRHLKFRDVLRVRADLRQEYERMKLDIAARSGGDRKVYQRIKEVECRAFVEGICGKVNGL